MGAADAQRAAPARAEGPEGAEGPFEGAGEGAAEGAEGRMARCLRRLGVPAREAGSDAAVTRAWAEASARDQDARTALENARARRAEMQEKVARVGAWRRQLQDQLADLEAETAARAERAEAAAQEASAFRVKRTEYAQQKREVLAALRHVDLTRVGHKAILEKRARLDAALKRREELQGALRPYHDLATDARDAEQQVDQARRTLVDLDARFQRLVAGLDL